MGKITTKIERNSGEVIVKLANEYHDSGSIEIRNQIAEVYFKKVPEYVEIFIEKNPEIIDTLGVNRDELESIYYISILESIDKTCESDDLDTYNTFSSRFLNKLKRHVLNHIYEDYGASLNISENMFYEAITDNSIIQKTKGKLRTSIEVSLPVMYEDLISSEDAVDDYTPNEPYKELDDIDEYIYQYQLEKELSAQTASLNAREKIILEERFRKVRTFRGAAESLNVGAERVRQIEAKALRKLRHPSRSKQLRQFLEFDYKIPEDKDKEVVKDDREKIVFKFKNKREKLTDENYKEFHYSCYCGKYLSRGGKVKKFCNNCKTFIIYPLRWYNDNVEDKYTCKCGFSSYSKPLLDKFDCPKCRTSINNTREYWAKLEEEKKLKEELNKKVNTPRKRVTPFKEIVPPKRVSRSIFNEYNSVTLEKYSCECGFVQAKTPGTMCQLCGTVCGCCKVITKIEKE